MIDDSIISALPRPDLTVRRLTDEELMLDIRERLLELVAVMNKAHARNIKTLFQIGPHDPANPSNMEAPYALKTLDMQKRYHDAK